MKHGRRAAVCLIGSAAVHVGLVAALAQSQGGQGAAFAQPHGFQVRLVTPGMKGESGEAAQRSAAMASSPSDVERQLAEFVPSSAPPAAAPALPPLEPAALPPLEPAAVGAAGLAAPRARVRYYLPSELDERARLAEGVNPDLTLPAGSAAIRDLELNLMINRDGTIDDVVIEDTRLDGPLRQLIVLEFKRLTFSPGKLGGAAVNSQMRIVVDLDPGPEVISRTVVH